MINISAFQLAQRFIGIKEVSGVASNPQILAMLKLDDSSIQGDDIAWCSAFVNYITWLLRLPRSKSLSARSWLQIGIPIYLNAALPDSDIVILKRGEGPQPDANVIAAPGHVGFFAGYDGKNIMVLGGNQGDAVNIMGFPADRLLGIRRLT